MTHATPKVEEGPAPGGEPLTARRWFGMILRALAGFGLLLLVVFGIATAFRSELESLARGFIDRFGVVGMAIGTLLADGFHFPVPPQFYMLIAIASGFPPKLALTAVCIGSLIGGAAGYTLARRVAHFPRVARWLERSSRAARQLFERYGYWTVLIASLTPFPYSMWCYLAGAYKLPLRVFAVLALFRMPRLVVFWYLIRFGWFLG
jgi:membrane protein YqaA with SNARE-associated domain